MNTIAGYVTNQFDRSNISTNTFPTDYLGSIQLLDKSGFSPYTDNSPTNSVLYSIFNRFVQKTGLDTTANKLKDEYLQNNASAQNAISLYGALENTFATKRPGEQAAIVDFLNTKIEDFITQKDSNQTGSLTQNESGISGEIFNAIDSNRDSVINSQEMQDNFYRDFTQLNNVLNYFQNTSGALIDIYA